MTESYDVEAVSSAPPERVFALLADSVRWKDWAGPMVRVSSWDREGVPAPGGVGAIRKVGTLPVFSREEIVAYDPPRHLAYIIVSGAPVRDYRADVDLEPDGAGTRIRWRGSFRPLVPGTGGLLRRFFSSTVGGFARRLAAYASGDVR